MDLIRVWAKRLPMLLDEGVTIARFCKRQGIKRLMAVNSLFKPDRIVRNFSNMGAAFPTCEVPRGDRPVSPLPTGSQMALPESATEWIKNRDVTSLLVLKDGHIVHESYYHGTGPQDRRISWSIAKSFLSTLFGVVYAEGAIASLDDPVVKYAPKLKGGAYDRVSIRNALQMTSGLDFNEDYLDFFSDINKMGRILALGGTMDGYTAGWTKRAAKPGVRWEYCSLDTHVIGMVIRGATGRELPELLSEKIIAPLGLEETPYYITDGQGVAFALGGLNLTTRDYARFGQMVLQNGHYDGQQVVPADWIMTSTRASAETPHGEPGYGYQWWMPFQGPDGVFVARGIYGQYVYIDQRHGLVIVATAADLNFRDEGAFERSMATFDHISKAL